MAPHKTQALNFTPLLNQTLIPKFQFAGVTKKYFSKNVSSILSGMYERDIETLTSLGVLDNKKAWNNFKKSSIFNKNKFPLLLTIYLKVHLGLSVD